MQRKIEEINRYSRVKRGYKGGKKIEEVELEGKIEVNGWIES